MSRIRTSDARDYFRRRGFVGNTAAFIVWTIKTQMAGYYASIPDDSRLLNYKDSGILFAPTFEWVRTRANRDYFIERERREFRMRLINDPWFHVFVAFREIK